MRDTLLDTTPATKILDISSSNFAEHNISKLLLSFYGAYEETTYPKIAKILEAVVDEIGEDGAGKEDEKMDVEGRVAYCEESDEHSQEVHGKKMRKRIMMTNINLGFECAL